MVVRLLRWKMVTNSQQAEAIQLLVIVFSLWLNCACDFRLMATSARRPIPLTVSDNGERALCG